jgi:hypothetical protein
MIHILQYIASLLFKNKPEIKKPPPLVVKQEPKPLTETKKEDNTKNEVDKLIEQLSFNNSESQYQDKRRREAFEKLGEMGKSAVVAIPILLDKYVNGFKWERQVAKDTLSKIDKEWYLQDICQTKVDYLVKKLLKDKPDCDCASEMLAYIGHPAQISVIKNLKSETDNYDKSRYVKFLKAVQNADKELLPIIQDIILHSENPTLLAASIDCLSNFNNIPEELKLKTGQYLNHDDEDIRLAAIRTAGKFLSEDRSFLDRNTFFVIPLFRCLSDGRSEIVTSAIDILSKTTSELAESFYVAVLKSNGDLHEEEYKAIVNEKRPWPRYGEIGHLLITREEYENNKFWIRVAYRKLNENNLLRLGGVLKILLKRERSKKSTSYRALLFDVLKYC